MFSVMNLCRHSLSILLILSELFVMGFILPLHNNNNNAEKLEDNSSERAIILENNSRSASSQTEDNVDQTNITANELKARSFLGNIERRRRNHLIKIDYRNATNNQIRKTRHAHTRYIYICKTRYCPPPMELNKRSTRGIRNYRLNKALPKK